MWGCKYERDIRDNISEGEERLFKNCFANRKMIWDLISRRNRLGKQTSREGKNVRKTGGINKNEWKEGIEGGRDRETECALISGKIF